MLRSLLVVLVCLGLLVPSAAVAGVQGPHRKANVSQPIGGPQPGAARHEPTRKAALWGARAKPRTPRGTFFGAPREAAEGTTLTAPGQVTKPAHVAAGGKRLEDTRAAVAMEKGTDRSTVFTRYATRNGILEQHVNGDATLGGRPYTILGKTTGAQFILRDEQGGLVAFTRKSAARGTLRPFKLAANQFIEGDKLLQLDGHRIRHTPHTSKVLADPDAGYVAPDGSRIMRKSPAAQAGAPSKVAFAQDESGVYYAHLTWDTYGDPVSLDAPSQSLLASDGTEYRAQQEPFEVFVGVTNGDVLQYRKGKIARPPPDTVLNSAELTLKDGSYGAIREVTANDGRKQLLVVNRFGVPFSMATSTELGLKPRNFALTDFADGTGIGKDNVIETTTQIKLPSGTMAKVPAAAVLLASGTLANGLVVKRTPSFIVLQTPSSDVHRLLIRRYGDWHEGSTYENFVDDKGLAWHAIPVDGEALDETPTLVVAVSIVGIGKQKTTAMFIRSRKGTQWVYEPAPTGSAQTIDDYASMYISNGESYRIVAKPLAAAKLGDDLELLFDYVGGREAPMYSTNPIRTALRQMDIDSPAAWAAHSARILPQLRQGKGPDFANIGPDVMRAIRMMLNPTAEEFPFAIGVKSNVLGTPFRISNWGSISGIDVADYHPADLAFFHVEPSGTLRPATLGELRAYFDATLGRQKPLVQFSDLARPAGLEIVASVDDLKWDTALVAKARQAVSTLRLDETDKIIVAYDACGNVEARPLHTDGVRADHPTQTQWRDWLAALPLLTMLQSDAFAHSAAMNNASWESSPVLEGPRATKLGRMPGGYNNTSGLRFLAHESLGHGTERKLPLMQTMIALTAYLDAAEGTNFMERSYQTGPWEQHTTNLEAYMEDSARYFKEHPYHAQLLMTVLQADSPAPQAMSDAALYQRLRSAMMPSTSPAMIEPIAAGFGLGK